MSTDLPALSRGAWTDVLTAALTGKGPPQTSALLMAEPHFTTVGHSEIL